MPARHQRSLVLCLIWISTVFVNEIGAQDSERILTLPIGQVTAVGSVGNSVVVGTSDGKIYASHDHGQSWSTTVLDETTDIYVTNLFTSSGGDVYALDPFRGVFISLDNGVTFERLYVPLLNDLLQLNSGEMIASTLWGMRKRVNSDTEWTEELYEWNGTPFVQSSFVSDVGNNILIAGNVSGFESNQGELIMSEDLGDSWTDISDRLSTDFPKPTVAAIQSECGLVIVGREDVYVSGQPLYERHELPFVAVNALVWNDVLISGGDDGVWKSSDCGRNWELIGFADSSVNAVSIVEKDNRPLLAVGNTAHLDLIDMATLTDIDEVPDMSETELSIYPNPVSERLCFENADIIHGPVRLSIINMLGQQVMTSEFDDCVDVRHLNPGAYIVQLSSNDARLFRRVVKQ